jgi:thioredoxin-like negative regulator of GroEL
MIAPIIDQLSSELAGRVRVAKLNVDENPRTASDLRITSLPTILILSQGRELRRLIGALPREAVLQELARLGLV